MEKENEPSGTYVIDEDYNIVTFNETASHTYPQLEIGKKCYRCLMNLEKPCDVCPVLNSVKGPQTYFDPIRKIYETVDAVEMPLMNGKKGYALIFSTTGEREDVSRQLPTSEQELHSLLEQEYFDKLTGGFTRKGFIRETEKILEDSDNSTDYAVLLFDLCNFKATNDIFGIDGGDKALKYVFATIHQSVLEPVVSARLEADWFVFLIRKEKLDFSVLKDLLNLEWVYENRIVQLHIRCGIYLIDDKALSVSKMIEWAIIAKQYIDQDGARNYAIFDSGMRKDYVGRAEILSSFQQGIENCDFQVYYQPIIHLKTERIYSAEALVRWVHPELGFLPPDQFIGIFEKNGFITQLDQYVIRQVYSFLQKLYAMKLPKIRVSVNLSWQDFYNNQIMNDIINFANSGVLPEGAVNYEVTETSIAALEQNFAYLLEQIKKTGASILLDDFGSGYSSFSMIANYLFNIVKIDKYFISQIETNQKMRAIISSLIEMCHRMGLETVAEGVENQQQLEFLKKQNCDYIQGYYYSKPLSEQEFLEYLNQIEQSNSGKDDNYDKVPEGKYFEEDPVFLKEVLNHSGQFIQICNADDYRMVYANELTKVISGHPELPYTGEKCYQYMLGLDAPCGHCPMKQMKNDNEKMIEVDDGQHVFALKAKYLNWKGQKLFIEYGRDVTDTKMSQKRYASQIKSILELIPEGQGVFHVDLTADKWLSSGGNAQNARNMQDVPDVDQLIGMIASFVPDKEGQEEFFQVFCRKAMIEAYEKGKFQIIKETKSYYDDGSIRWSRITAHLIVNPGTEHLESVIYGVDISKEKQVIENLEKQHQYAAEEMKKEVQEAMDMYSQADHDRRIDFLTGLRNRLDLFELLKKSETGKIPRIMLVYMLDIDNFKKINDFYGHRAGDACLKKLGSVLREYGADNQIMFYRYGGEEFLGISISGKVHAKKSAEEILQLIREIEVETDDGKNITFTASIGYTCKPEGHEAMIEMADRAMYIAKKQGKDRSICFEEI